MRRGETQRIHVSSFPQKDVRGPRFSLLKFVQSLFVTAVRGGKNIDIDLAVIIKGYCLLLTSFLDMASALIGLSVFF